ncbi:MAG: hypothetical protein IH977_08025 [Nitrospinae bacterium]|nr:hypothetical protein [Nitrospinota bacterium]
MVPFSDRDQQALADRLRTIKGKFLLTNTDNQVARALYRGFQTTVLRGQLSTPRTHRRILHHLVVRNYS